MNNFISVVSDTYNLSTAMNNVDLTHIIAPDYTFGDKVQKFKKTHNGHKRNKKRIL